MRGALLLLALLLGTLAGALATLRQPATYVGTTTVFVSAPEASPTTVRGLAQIARTRPVLADALQTLGLDDRINPQQLADATTVEPVDDSTLLRVQIVDVDPVRAQVLATAVAEALARQSPGNRLGRAAEWRKLVEDAQTASRGRLDEANKALADLRANPKADPAQRESAERQVASETQTLAAWTSLLDATPVAELTVWERGESAAPAQATWPRNAALGGLLALVVALPIVLVGNRWRRARPVARPAPAAGERVAAQAAPTLGAEDRQR